MTVRCQSVLSLNNLSSWIRNHAMYKGTKSGWKMKEIILAPTRSAGENECLSSIFLTIPILEIMAQMYVNRQS